jgi:hypothetical protein
MIEYNRAELPVKKEDLLVWLSREVQQWVRVDGQLSYHVPTNQALYSVQAQAPQIDWRVGLLRVDQAYVIEPNDGRDGEAHFLPLFEFEAIGLPNGLIRIVARCLSINPETPTGNWLARCLDTLWAEMLRVCTPSGTAGLQESMNVTERREAQSLLQQFDDAQENLRLVQERKAQYVQEVDIPLQLIKDEKHWIKQIAELEAALRSK